MRKGKRKGYLYFFALVLAVLLFAVSVSAKDGELMPKEYGDVVDELPSEVGSLLPEGIYSDNVEEVGSAVAQMSTAEYILSVIGDIVVLKLGQTLELLALIVGILILSALFSAIRSAVHSEALSKAMSFCSSCAIFATVISVQIKHLELVSSFFDRIGAIFLGIIPATGVIYAMGGNVSTAVASSGTLYIFLAFVENFCASTVLPIASISTAFALCQSLSPSIELGGLSSAIKKSYTFILGFIMTVLVATLSSQTALAASADSISARAAKLVASTVIPVVGGSVGETIRTLSSSVGYLKNVCGIGGIFFIILLLLPTLITLLLTRLVFMLGCAVADMLGCKNESRALGEIGSVYGTMIAVVSMVSVMFILALTIFVRCAVAVG